jgi:tRNA-dihydrouridine synthase 2
MLARAAERNPSVFNRAGPLCNVKVIIPQLLKIAKYTDNPWGNTKFLLSQFKPGAGIGKVEKKEVQEVIARSKSMEEVSVKLNVDLQGGAQFMVELETILAQRVDTTFEEP